MPEHIVSNFLFWLGVVSVVGQFAVMTYTNFRLRGTGAEVEFNLRNIAAGALALLAAATARYLGY